MTDQELKADDALQNRTLELTNEFTIALGQYCDSKVHPITMTNAEYAAASSSLLIALTRQLGRCAAAFGEANGQPEEDVRTTVMRMFNRNFDRALDAMHGEGGTVQ